MIFNGVFNSYYIFLLCMNPVQGSIQGCSLTASCRSCDKYYPVRPLKMFFKFLSIFLVEADLPQTQESLLSVKKSEYCPLTVRCRYHRDPDIYIPSSEQESYPPILRQPFFSNIEIRHYLDPAYQGVLNYLGRSQYPVQHTVHP